MRANLIQKFVSNLTQAWFQPPRGMDAAAQAEHVAEMAKAVNKAVPLRLTSEQVEDALENAKSVLLADAKSRAWPIIREVVAAVHKGLPRDMAAASDADRQSSVRRRQIEVARDWWTKFHDVPGWLSHEHVFAALIADGIPAHDLWKAGVDLPRHMRDWPEAAHQVGTVAFKRFGEAAE